jgi:uncharacterized protein involved in exopolysaccharide biosynthesis
MTTTELTPSTETAMAEKLPRVDQSFAIEWRNPERRLAHYVGAVWQAKLVVLLVTLIATFIGLFVALNKPNTYMSTATLMVHSPSSVGSASEAAANLLGAGAILPAHVVNAVDIAKSSVVLRRVVQQIGVEKILQPYQPIRMGKRDNMGIVERITDAMHDLQASWFAPAATNLKDYDPEQLTDTAVEMLNRRLDVWPSTRGTTITLFYRDFNPRRAQQVLEAVIDESGRHYTQVFAPPEGQDWIKERVDSAAHRRLMAEETLAKFREENGAGDFADEIKILGTELANMRSTLNLARMRVEENRTVSADLDKRLATLEQRIREVTQETERPDGIRDNLEQQIINLQVRLADALAQSTTERESPAVVGLRKQIEFLQGQMRDRTGLEPSRITSIRPNPEYEELNAELRRRRLDQMELATQIPLLEEEVGEKTKELADRRALQEQAGKLEKEFNDARIEHEKLESAAKTYEINRELDTRGLKALRTVAPASLPLSKEGPSRGKLILGAMLGGLLLCFSIVIVRARLSRVLFTPGEVMFALGRSDVVGVPMLKPRNVRRYETARTRGWN